MSGAPLNMTADERMRRLIARYCIIAIVAAAHFLLIVILDGVEELREHRSSSGPRGVHKHSPSSVVAHQ